MYSTNAGLLCAALLVLAVCPGQAFRHLTQKDANCAAVAGVQIKVEAGGSCEAKSASFCSAIAESQSQYREAFKEWFGGYRSPSYYSNRCDKGKAEAAAWAVAKAIAATYTRAYVGVKCDYGTQGHACGWSQSNGDAWAIATAEAVANAVADTGIDNAQGFCYADVQAISVVVADVAAKSLADGCARGGQSDYEFSENYQSSLQTGIAEAFAKAFAKACQYGNEYQAQAECYGKGSSRRESETSGKGDGYAHGAAVDPCTGRVQAKCCDPDYKQNICTCAGRTCKSRTYNRTSVNTSDARRTWVGSNGEKCYCS